MKNIINQFSWLVSATLILAVRSTQAQPVPNTPVSTNVFAESTVQYSASGATSFTNYVSGYDKIKYSATQPCKSYFKFDFTGQIPNTNYTLKLSFKTTANNQNQDLMLWALNQQYPAFTNPSGTNNPSLTWSGAQANFTGTNEPAYNTMLTTGSYTATLVNSFVGSSSTNASVGVSFPAPWGQYLFNNQIVVVLTATNGPDYNGNGARFLMTNATATFQPLTAGTQPPTISPITNQTVRSTQSSSPIAFTVSDPLDTAASLTNIAISLGNTNVSFLSTNIAVGSGGSRTLTFTPTNNLAAGTTANVTVTVTLTDSSGNSATSSFLLTVPPYISLPVFLSGTNVNYLPPTNRVGAGSVTIPFQVVDTNLTASSLVVTGAVSISTNIASISFTQSGGGAGIYTNNCTITVNMTGSGVGIVSLQAIDQTNSVTILVNLAVMVLPDSSYAVCDLMNYQPSSSYLTSGHADLLNVSGNLWATRGSGSGSVNMLTSVPHTSPDWPGGVAWIRGSSSGNQNQVRLVGAPYRADSHKVLYASINAQWFDPSLYGGSAYYPGQSAGGFVEFAADATTTGVTMASICTVTNSANTTNNDGSFYLALYDGATNPPSVNTTYSGSIPNYNTSGVLPQSPVNIVMSYDVDTGISQLWLNQADSTGTNVSLQDVAVTNLANVSYLVLRQNSGMGNMLIESAVVKVVSKPFPTVTNIAKSGSTVTISYTDAPGVGGTASVVGSSTVNGAYNPVAAAINEVTAGNYTATLSGQTGQTMFYRIKQTAAMPTVTFPF